MGWLGSVRLVVMIVICLVCGFGWVVGLGCGYCLELRSLVLLKVRFTVRVCWWVDCGCYGCFKRGFCFVFKFVGLFGFPVGVGYYLLYGGILCLG